MPIIVNEKNDIYVVDMDGELGFSELEKVSQVLSTVHKQPKHTVLNMEKLVFLSSLVIRDVVELWKRLRASNCSLIIIGMNSAIHEIFKTTGLTSVLDIREIDVTEAMEKIKS